MKSRRPSLKALERAFPGKGKALRDLLTSSAAVRAQPVNSAPYQCDQSSSRLCDQRMKALDAELGTYGVESAVPGHGTRSPGFTYCNTGDAYEVTIIRFDDGRYRIGCWGDVVERGYYD